jgi:hypothetical protein
VTNQNFFYTPRETVFGILVLSDDLKVSSQ